MTVHVGGRLTVATVKAAGPGKYADGAGLYLQVGPKGGKSWYLRYTLAGKTHDFGLGPFPLISLAEARERGAAARRQLLDGIDPLMAQATADRQEWLVDQVAAQRIDTASLDPFAWRKFADMICAASKKRKPS